MNSNDHYRSFWTITGSFVRLQLWFDNFFAKFCKILQKKKSKKSSNHNCHVTKLPVMVQNERFEMKVSKPAGPSGPWAFAKSTTPTLFWRKCINVYYVKYVIDKHLHTFTKVSIERSILARATFSRIHIAHISGQAILTLAYYE